ncbi:MAG: aminomethyl-transferring glycine dehydrogenase [Elusimicrobiota bacterium]
MKTIDPIISAANKFSSRHMGPRPSQIKDMARELGFDSLESLTDAAIPRSIRAQAPLPIGPGLSESQSLERLAQMAGRNAIFRSFIGKGYYDCVTPPVIQRNVLENPGWYTAYTPYQAEIAQGRLEALINFQTLIIELTGLDVANASLLDEATAAAEAMGLSRAASTNASNLFLAAQDCHPQTLSVVQTRARALGIEVQLQNPERFDFSRKPFGALVQYPATDGLIRDYSDISAAAHAAGCLLTIAADPLALAILKSPGGMGADIAVGSAQRFGVPMGFGGPHAAYFAAKSAYKRLIPGRIVGASKDAFGEKAYRLALQTREQHIRREKATSNICTAQVLLAAIAGFYAVYHGPDGLSRIARRAHALAARLAQKLSRAGFSLRHSQFFDTVRVDVSPEQKRKILAAALAGGANLRDDIDGSLCVSFDETSTEKDARNVFSFFTGRDYSDEDQDLHRASAIPESLDRQDPILRQEVFSLYRSETEMMRYIKRLEAKDLSLTTSMIALGSCTMKLNAASEMLPITWPGFARVHPFAPKDQAQGYSELFADLERWLCDITGFEVASLQPNAGSQGEYAGLLAIRGYHDSRGDGGRRVCLIPASAHGTNPASATMAGLSVVPVATMPGGDIDIADLRAKIALHERSLAVLMITYPSTHGVFEDSIKTICGAVHAAGGQVYLDGANMNAMVGLCRPIDLGADVCHLNLHKTFCIPHGGGGPGMGPIAAAKHLAPFLPGRPGTPVAQGAGAVSAAPWGSAMILPIPWAYIAQMGGDGLTQASRVAILNANYLAKKLSEHYPVLFRGSGGLVAHECILDLRRFKDSAGVQVEDVAKRLMDYGFHAPTVSWPVPGTMMIEPTESESKEEIDRFCEAMILIREEIRRIEDGRMDRGDNPLKNAPHTARSLAAQSWDHPYSREEAAYPAPWLKTHKYWPPIGRIDNAYGDRNFICSCS